MTGVQTCALPICRIARNEQTSIRDFFRSFVDLFATSLPLGAFSLGVFFIVWVGVDFYSHLGGALRYPGFLLAALLVWLGVFVLLMHAHIMPVLVHGDRRFISILRKSALLTLDNMLFTVGILVQTTALAALCVVTGAGLVLIAGSLVAVLLVSGHRVLLRRYRPDDPDLQDDPETRTWRDLWRPWESRARG